MSFIPFWKKVWKKWKFFNEIRRQRKELLKLDDRMLNDIGLSRVDAEREAGRPFWDVVDVKDASLRERNKPTFFKMGSGQKSNPCSEFSRPFKAERSGWRCCERGR